MSIKFSVITATLNRKEYLPRCIESVAMQSYPFKEHLIIDGGSSDGTVEIIETYAGKYSHIRWLSEKDSGLSNAFNKGLRMATGDAICCLGDDDFYEPDIFDTVASEFERYPSAGVVSGNCSIVRNDGSLAGFMKAGFTSRSDLIATWRYWGREVMLPAPSTFFRRAVVDVVGGFDESDKYAMDYHHWIKITEKFPVRVIDKLLANFRLDAGTISYSHRAKQAAEGLKISKKYWGSILSSSYYRFLYSYWRCTRWPDYKGRIKSLLRWPHQGSPQRVRT